MHPRVTLTMNECQIVDAMLSDMGIMKEVNMRRDLDHNGQDYDDAVINVSAVWCFMSSSSYLYIVLFVLCAICSC
jgi:hypothetical protein